MCCSGCPWGGDDDDEGDNGYEVVVVVGMSIFIFFNSIFEDRQNKERGNNV